MKDFEANCFINLISIITVLEQIIQKEEL